MICSLKNPLPRNIQIIPPEAAGFGYSMFGNFLSGVGKVRLSLYHSFAMIVINIPLSIFLAKYLNLGSAGVIIGTCICVLPQVFLHPIQYKKIISNTANGIWGK